MVYIILGLTIYYTLARTEPDVAADLANTPCRFKTNHPNRDDPVKHKEQVEMKISPISLVLAVSVGTLFSFPGKVVGQSEQEQALKSFEKVVAKFSVFCQTKQYLVYKQKFSESPTGFIVCAYEYTLAKDVSYDVQKTQSLVSPLVGYISLGVILKSNASCGALEFSKRRWCWDNTDAAVKDITTHSCYKENAYGEGYVDEVMFSFAYQGGKWIFKDVIRTKWNKREPAISTALGNTTDPGIPITEPSGLAINEKWMDLINPDAK
jgi:hypothetical protein